VERDAKEPALEQTTLHVRRAAAGEGESIAWLIQRFSPLLRAQARYRLGRRLVRLVEPDDLVQDVWVRALPKLTGLVPRDGRLTPVVLKFLSVTLLRRLKDLMEKHVVGKPRPLSAGGPEAGTRSGVLGDLAVDGTGVVTLAVRRESASELATAIDGLDDKDRAIVVLRAIEQRSNAEAALLLDLPADTASARYRRALEKLRHLLPQELVEAGSG
jgi:RNA polymerase sigma factor (sigma-70 family)